MWAYQMNFTQLFLISIFQSMKKILLSAFVLLFLLNTNAQNSKNQIIGTAGTTHGVQNGNTLSWTIGEPIVGAISINDKLLTQGFHQPYLFDCQLDIDTKVSCVGNDEFMVSVDIEGDDQEFIISSSNADAFNGVTSKEFSDGPFANNTSYTFSVALKNRQFCNQTITVDNIDCNTNSLQLLAFNGEVLADGNILNWSTYGAITNGSLQIQRSLDGVNYTTIHAYTPDATEFEQQTFVDSNPSTGLNYYQLVKINEAGQVEDTKKVNLLRIENTSNVEYTVTTYPNPVVSQLNVTLSDYQEETVLIGLYSPSGNILMTNEVDVLDNNIMIDFRNFDNALYLLSIATPKGELITTQKIQKLD